MNVLIVRANVIRPYFSYFAFCVRANNIRPRNMRLWFGEDAERYRH